MRRIGLAIVFALGLFLAPFAVEAQQQAEKVYRVGWIGSFPTATPRLQAAFRLGLSERGYVEGRNLIFEWRYLSVDRRGGRTGGAAWLTTVAEMKESKRLRDEQTKGAAKGL
jgi:hypothetical protein